MLPTVTMRYKSTKRRGNCIRVVPNKVPRLSSDNARPQAVTPTCEGLDRNPEISGRTSLEADLLGRATRRQNRLRLETGTCIFLLLRSSLPPTTQRNTDSPLFHTREK